MQNKYSTTELSPFVIFSLVFGAYQDVLRLNPSSLISRLREPYVVPGIKQHARQAPYPLNWICTTPSLCPSLSHSLDCLFLVLGYLEMLRGYSWFFVQE